MTLISCLTLLKLQLRTRPLIFKDFNPTPLAAASIAQVYSATLKENNKEVVIKVVRPGIKKIIQTDVSLMKRIAAFSEHRFKDAK